MQRDKDKKLTVQFYANMKLKAKRFPFKGQKIDMYPLYVRVIYDAVNTRFKADFEDKTTYVDVDLTRLDHPDLKYSSTLYLSQIEKTLRKEIKVFKEGFKLAGIGYRLNMYKLNLGAVFGIMLIAELEETFEELGRELDLKYSDREEFRLISFLLKSKITLFDWVLGNGKENLRQELKSAGADEEESRFAVKLVERLVCRKLE